MVWKGCGTERFWWLDRVISRKTECFFNEKYWRLLCQAGHFSPTPPPRGCGRPLPPKPESQLEKPVASGVAADRPSLCLAVPNCACSVAPNIGIRLCQTVCVWLCLTVRVRLRQTLCILFRQTLRICLCQTGAHSILSSHIWLVLVGFARLWSFFDPFLTIFDYFDHL